MKPYYRKATVEDALRVASNLRPEDKNEVEGLGHNPSVLPICLFQSAVCVAFFNKDNEIAGIAGVVDDEKPHVGQIWMLCTPAIQKNPHTFVRQARKWVDGLSSSYRMLWNIADARNTLHHKFLHLLGFKTTTTVYPEPYYLPYLEIVKLCAYQPPQQAQVPPLQPRQP